MGFLGNGLQIKNISATGIGDDSGDGLQINKDPSPLWSGFGNGISQVGGGLQYASQKPMFDPRKLASALTSYRPQQMAAPGTPGIIDDQQRAYEQYLKVFNAQNRG